MRVHLLSARNFKAHSLTYPLRAFAGSIEERGMDVKIHFRPHSGLSHCDVLCVLSQYFRKHPRVDRVAFLRRYRPQVRTLIYFDTTDSTGTPSFEVLPAVDLYAKSQLLKERMRYTQALYGMRCYTDYYHDREGIVDRRAASPRVAPAGALHKLAVAWNIGLGDYHTFRKWRRRLRILLPRATYRLPTTPPGAAREIDVSYRVSVHHERATIAFQREETGRQLADLAAHTDYKVLYQGKLPYRAYKAELQRTKVIPSPFGWGEICFRDFECLLSGAVLLKPNMSHVETWPDYYVPHLTYVPHAWDFSDFQETVIDLLTTPATRQRIARTAQARYLETLSAAGGERFAEHFGCLMEQAIDKSERRGVR
jgi:hypothetical protein